MSTRLDRIKVLLKAVIGYASSHGQHAKASRARRAKRTLFPAPTAVPPPPVPVVPSAPHGFMPGAIIKNIPPGSNDPAIVPVAVSQHIAVSNADTLLPGFTDGRGIESHFYILKDGTTEQYRSIFFQADAQFDSNHPDMGVVSVEHQGGVGADLFQPMPKAQLDAFHRVILFVASQSPAFRFQVCPAFDKPGVGYHAMFPEWNLNHHSCPGPARIAQFEKVTVPWLAAQ